MRNRLAGWFATLTVGAVGSAATLPWTLGQTPATTPKAQPPGTPTPVTPGPKAAPPRPLPPNLTPTSYAPTPGPNAAETPGAVAPARDLAHLSPLGKHLHTAAQLGTDWLFRVHQPTGRFLPGWLPDLDQPTETDHFLRQAGATLALARAARFFKEEKYATRARQAVLTLLAETGPDPSDPPSRCTTLHSTVVNRLGAAGLLLAAIHELPDPAPDLLDQGEQLARYIARQQQPDGSLHAADGPAPAADPDAVNHYPGMALYGLMRSQQLRPGPAKIEVVRKALGYYRGWWRDHRHPAFVVWQVPAFAEACLRSTDWTRDKRPDPAYAAFVFEMCDWLCPLQLGQLDPRHPLWHGGFPDVADGKPVPGAPKVTGAAYAAALVDACRVTRQLPDADRYTRYRDAARRALQFLTTLQYTEATTQHFAAAYRQRVLAGGFHASHEDGSLRLDYAQHAVCALVQYLACLPDA